MLNRQKGDKRNSERMRQYWKDRWEKGIKVISQGPQLAKIKNGV